MKKAMISVLFAALSVLMASATTQEAQTFQSSVKKRFVELDELPSKKTYGIDVSTHQGTIDWQQVAQTKVAFVFVKATEGAAFTDPRYKENIKGAREAGLKVGVYHFFRTTSGAHDQFNNFVNTVGKDHLDLIPVIDVEEKKNYTQHQLRDSLRVFVDLIEQHFGCKPIIYTGHKFYNEFLGIAFKDCMLNVAQYVNTFDRKPSVNRDWQLWQFTESAKVSGIKWTVDLNVLGDKVKLEDIMLPEKRKNKKKK